MAHTAPEKLLLIGYGNTLRGDDGLGALVVSEVAVRHQELVKACVVQQLTPELCTMLAEYGAVIFVDASAGCDGQGCRLVPVENTVTTAWDTHLSSPAALLALAEKLYDARPRAWCLGVPGEDFRLGAGLSTRGRVGACEAVTMLEECLRLL